MNRVSPSTNISLTLVETVWLILLVVAVFGILCLCPTSAVAAEKPPNGKLAVIDATAQSPVEQLVPVAVQRTGELETRAALERLFGKPFPKARLPWIINPETNRRLELDCHNEELRLSVKYNGIQHQVFPNPFHRTLAEFEAQQRRDAYKAKACRERGVCLLVVPHTVRRAEIQPFLLQELQARGFKINI